MKAIINNIWNKIVQIYGIFNSIKIISNPILNFVLKTVIILVIFLILKAILKSIFRPYRPTYVPESRRVRPLPTQNSIDECISQEDLKFQMDQAEEEILNTIQRNRQQIADTLKKANQRIDVSWLDSCNKILRISNTLDNNLAYYAKRNLETSRFQYYTHLHFRAMLAADIVHKEYEKIDRSFKEMNQFIVKMKSHPEFRGNYKTQVYQQKDQIKSVRSSFLNQVHHLNHETEIIRDKIGRECGDRGRRWWLERTRHKR